MKTTNTTNRTNTENTTTRTTAIKEGKTMKNTKNTRNRIIAGALAAITTMTALAVSTSAANVQKYPGPTGIEIQIPVTPDEKKPDLFGASANDDAKEETPSGEQKTTPYIPASEILEGSEPAISETKPDLFGASANNDVKEETPSGEQKTTPYIPASEILEGSEPAKDEIKPDLFGASANDDAKEETPSGMQEKTPEILADEIPEGSEPADATVTLPDGLFVSVPSDQIEIPAELLCPVEVIDEMAPVASAKTEYKPEADAKAHENEPSDGESEDEGLRSQAEEIANRIIGGFIDGGLDMMGDAFPGGKLFSEPLKAILGDVINDKDPTEAAIDRLSEDQKKYYEDIKDRIVSLNKDLTTYTRYIENVVVNEGDKNSLAEMFRGMSSNLRDLSTRVKNVMTNDNYSPEQKLVMLADINNGEGSTNYCAAVRQWADQINSTIGSKSETALDIDLYNTLINLASKNYLFAGEAYNEAQKSAKVLTEQYMYANALLLQCQNAAVAVNGLSAAQIEELCKDPEVLEAYTKCKKSTNSSFQADKQDETVSRILDCIQGFKDFKDKEKEGNRYIKKGTVDNTVIDYYCQNHTYITGGNLQKMYDKQYLKGQDLTDLADYARAQNMSIKDLLDKNNQDITYVVKMPSITGKASGNVVTSKQEKHCYIVVDPKITRQKKFSNFEKAHSEDGVDQYYYDVAEVIKVIDIYDPESKVQDLTLRTWTDRRNGNGYEWTDWSTVKDHPHDFLTIGSHEATEKDDLVFFNPTNTDPTKGPTVGGRVKLPNTITILDGPKGY